MSFSSRDEDAGIHCKAQEPVPAAREVVYRSNEVGTEGMAQKAPSLTERHVSSRIRLRRLQLGMSQEDLARALKVTCPQVQKYEKGMNRISAGRLQEIAKALSAPIQFFYDDGPEAGDASREGEATMLAQAMNSSEIVGFIQLMASFRSPKIRQSMMDLAKAVAEELREGGTAPDRS
jgi:transcriptional regulator with XRE-family HTH domain